ncbi:hypothetical protein MPSEU_000305300 [Mayamaea pseudoterrestris]|nr:hypothetical protein MPSEU_000305300 [Mayamaea pseudoterrestris]
MKRITALLLGIYLFVTQVTLTASTTDESSTANTLQLDDTDEDDGTEFKVIIGYRNKPTRDFQVGNLLSRRNNRLRQHEGRGLARVNAIKASLNRTMIRELEQRGDIQYVEEDRRVHLLGEMHTLALKQVQGLSSAIPKPPTYATGACADPDSFKIGIVDSGLDVSHPDLPCANMNDAAQATCVGEEFGIPDGQYWYQPTLSHGTMVGGIISAVRGNNRGISGVLDNSKICLIVARVFADNSDGAADVSSIIDGINWVYEQGAKVINLSLGGPSAGVTDRNFYQAIRDSGVLLVVAAGNDGSSTKSYPASYSSCMSVAAVDENLQHAAFSQYNADVDIAAPGVHILSTSPLGLGALATLSFSNAASFGQFMENSPMPSGSISGPLIECPGLGTTTCPGSSGQVCLIERGENTFEEKALNCEAGGGIAAIIYNNVDFDLQGGALASPTSVTIPVISISQDAGNNLLNNHIGQTVTITSQDGYEYADGTSFSAPFVAGGAASIWQACPSCSADDVEQCLLESAKDLGAAGADDYFGHGLLQVGSAYSCLVDNVQCCDSSGTRAPSPPTPPTPAPAMAPVAAPAPATSQDCSSDEDAYVSCFDNSLTVWQEEICRYCVNAAVPYDVDSLTCADIDDAICPAITDVCAAYCGSCVKSIETYMGCALQTLRSDCKLDCSYGTSGTDDNMTAAPAPSSSGGGVSVGLIGVSSPTTSPSNLRSGATPVGVATAFAAVAGLMVLLV